VFERFTERCIKVIMLAQEEARRLDHDYVAAEHIFLGLIGEGKGIAAQELKKAGITLPDARTIVEDILGRGDHVDEKRPWWQKILGPFREMPFSANAKQLLELSWDEARKLDVNYIGTEHLLLGLLRLDEEHALEVLRRCKLDQVNLRESVKSAIRTGASRTR
jgi:ATP-dependent Clp protease ATP-binding subunit ClpC